MMQVPVMVKRLVIQVARQIAVFLLNCSACEADSTRTAKSFLTVQTRSTDATIVGATIVGASHICATIQRAADILAWHARAWRESRAPNHTIFHGIGGLLGSWPGYIIAHWLTRHRTTCHLANGAVGFRHGAIRRGNAAIGSAIPSNLGMRGSAHQAGSSKERHPRTNLKEHPPTSPVGSSRQGVHQRRASTLVHAFYCALPGKYPRVFMNIVGCPVGPS